jgi:hypothetical protein
MTAKAAGIGIALAVLAVVAWFGLREGRVGNGTGRLAGDPLESLPDPGAWNDSIPSIDGRGPIARDTQSMETSERVVLGTESRTILRGTVVDARGKGIPGARIELEGLPRRYVTTIFGSLAGESDCAHTDARGAFEWTLEGALATDTEHWLWCDHEDYLSARVAVDLAHGTDIVLAARPAIEGRFLDPDGHPVGGPAEAWVQVQPPRNGFHDFQLKVDPDGRFHSHGLPEGELGTIRGRVRGFAAGTANSRRTLAAGDRIVLDVVLPRGKTVRGVVLCEGSRQPIAAAAVFAESQDPTPNGIYPSTTSDSLGRFELQGVEPSTYSMSASQSPARIYEIEARKLGYVFPKAWRESIRLSPAQQSTDLVEDIEIFCSPCRLASRCGCPTGTADW